MSCVGRAATAWAAGRSVARSRNWEQSAIIVGRRRLAEEPQRHDQARRSLVAGGFDSGGCDEDRPRRGQLQTNAGAQQKGHGRSIRRMAMTSILKRDRPMAIPPSRRACIQDIVKAISATRTDPARRRRIVWPFAKSGRGNRHNRRGLTEVGLRRKATGQRGERIQASVDRTISAGHTSGLWSLVSSLLPLA